MTSIRSRRPEIEDDAELVATETVGGVVGTDPGRETAAEAAKQRVAGRVPEGVVVGLEAVEVEEREDVRSVSDPFAA